MFAIGHMQVNNEVSITGESIIAVNFTELYMYVCVNHGFNFTLLGCTVPFYITHLHVYMYTCTCTPTNCGFFKDVIQQN